MPLEDESRLKLSLRVLGAMACAGLCWNAFDMRDSFKPMSDTKIEVAIAIYACIFIPPFVAIGLLCGRAKVAAIIGTAIFLLLLALLAWGLSQGEGI